MKLKKNNQPRILTQIRKFQPWNFNSRSLNPASLDHVQELKLRKFILGTQSPQSLAQVLQPIKPVPENETHNFGLGTLSQKSKSRDLSPEIFSIIATSLAAIHLCQKCLHYFNFPFLMFTDSERNTKCLQLAGVNKFTVCNFHNHDRFQVRSETSVPD